MIFTNFKGDQTIDTNVWYFSLFHVDMNCSENLFLKNNQRSIPWNWSNLYLSSFCIFQFPWLGRKTGINLMNKWYAGFVSKIDFLTLPFSLNLDDMKMTQQVESIWWNAILHFYHFLKTSFDHLYQRKVLFIWTNLSLSFTGK